MVDVVVGVVVVVVEVVMFAATTDMVTLHSLAIKQHVAIF